MRYNGGDEGRAPVRVPEFTSEHSDQDCRGDPAGYQKFIEYVSVTQC